MGTKWQKKWLQSGYKIGGEGGPSFPDPAILGPITPLEKFSAMGENRLEREFFWLEGPTLDPRPRRRLDRGMKATLLALFVALLMVGCGEQSQSVGSEGDVEEFERTKRLAEGGDKADQYMLGGMYDQGKGVLQDYKEAFKWYSKSAEQGFAPAQFNLGCSYSHGEGVPQDYKEAFKWFTKAAEQGHARAQHNLGNCYANGEGVPKDYKEAFKWYTKAAEQGNAPPQAMLGVMYDNGYGVPEDWVHAYAWFNVAQANGNEDAKKLRDELELTPEQVAKAQALSTEIQKRIEADRKD